MSDASNGSFKLTPQQVEVFAAGLYQLAACDGVDEREIRVINEFLDEAGAPEVIDRLPSLSFDPAHAYAVLESSWLRGVFLKAAYLLIQADGRITEEERETLDWMCSAFGIQGGTQNLASQVEGQSL